MKTVSAYRLLKDLKFVELLTQAMSDLGLAVYDHFEPGNAYAPALVKLKKNNEPSANYVIQFDRVWLGDRSTYKDSRVSLKYNGETVVEIDVASVLSTDPSTTLAQLVIAELVEGVQNAK